MLLYIMPNLNISTHKAFLLARPAFWQGGFFDFKAIANLL